MAATPKSSTSCLSAGVDVKTLDNQSPVTCAVCEEIIIDGNDSTMLCEGLCDGWFHRHCAGLSVAHFDALSVSLDPFFCVGCSQASYKKELVDLTNTANSLQDEISQLHNILEEKCV